MKLSNGMNHPIFFLILVQLFLFEPGSAANSAASPCFAPPTAPNVGLVEPSPTRTFAGVRSVPARYGLYTSVRTALGAKKKSKSAVATKKIQVKLLHHVAGTGQAGDVVQVTPAFFNNKLRPTRLAETITDDQVKSEQDARDERDKMLRAKATALQSRLSDLTLTISRKTGPDGKLFGGVGPKVVMSELQVLVNDEFFGQKSVKVSEILGENGKKLRGDIKKTGSYVARIVLAGDISTKVEIVIEPET